MPKLSKYYENKKPSAIRLAQIEFLKRKNPPKVVNTAIGNVSLPMHPSMQARMFDLKNSPFASGVVKYTVTVGEKEAQQAFINSLQASGLETPGLFVHITDGGSTAMELLLLGVCAEPGSNHDPILLIEPAYTNYMSMAERTGRKTIAVTRSLGDDGHFTLPNFQEIEKVIVQEKPASILVIPYDNPSGHFIDRKSFIDLAKLAVKYDLWLVSDEAYRELFYTKDQVSSIWALSEEDVPGITGRRISIESVSKIYNACGLRIGALITDNQQFHEQAVAEYTTNLCANAIGQHIFGSIAKESIQDLQDWFAKQRKYYQDLTFDLTGAFKKASPDCIISSPDASLYSVVDVRNMVDENFNATDFVVYCAKEGQVDLEGENYTLLVAPMAGFYSEKDPQKNPGRTQMRIAYVESPENMQKVAPLFFALLEKYLKKDRQ